MSLHFSLLYYLQVKLFTSVHDIGDVLKWLDNSLLWELILAMVRFGNFVYPFGANWPMYLNAFKYLFTHFLSANWLLFSHLSSKFEGSSSLLASILIIFTACFVACRTQFFRLALEIFNVIKCHENVLMAWLIFKRLISSRDLGHCPSEENIVQSQ